MTWFLAVLCRKAAVKHTGTAPTELGMMELPWGTWHLHSRWSGTNTTKSPEQSAQLWLGPCKWEGYGSGKVRQSPLRWADSGGAGLWSLSTEGPAAGAGHAPCAEGALDQSKGWGRSCCCACCFCCSGLQAGGSEGCGALVGDLLPTWKGSCFQLRLPCATCGCTYDAFVVINAGKPGLKCKGKGGCQSSQKGWKANDLGVKSC